MDVYVACVLGPNSEVSCYHKDTEEGGRIRLSFCWHYLGCGRVVLPVDSVEMMMPFFGLKPALLRSSVPSAVILSNRLQNVVGRR